MAVPSIDLLPAPALSTDPEDVFNSKTDATLLAQRAMVPQINTSLTWIGQQVTAADGYRQAAATSAQNAAASAQTALNAGQDMSAQVAQAAAYANNAKASADAAEAVGPGRNTARLHAAVLSFM